jgi:hypothetical protein
MRTISKVEWLYEYELLGPDTVKPFEEESCLQGKQSSEEHVETDELFRGI